MVQELRLGAVPLNEGYCLMANGQKYVLFHCYPSDRPASEAIALNKVQQVLTP
jgi:hypothetical protein